MYHIILCNSPGNHARFAKRENKLLKSLQQLEEPYVACIYVRKSRLILRTLHACVSAVCGWAMYTARLYNNIYVYDTCFLKADSFTYERAHFGTIIISTHGILHGIIIYVPVYTYIYIRTKTAKQNARANTCAHSSSIFYMCVCVCYKFRVTERAHIIGLMFSDRPSGSARES